MVSKKKLVGIIFKIVIIILVLPLVIQLYIVPFFQPHPSIKFNCDLTGTATYNKSGSSFVYNSISFRLFNEGKSSAHNFGWRIIFNPEFHLTASDIDFNYDKSSNCQLVTPFNNSVASNSVYIKCEFLDPSSGLNVRLPLSNKQKYYWSEYWSDELEYKTISMDCK